MKKILFFAVLFVTLGLMLLIGVALAADPSKACTGPAYEDHPGLVAECQHQQSVNHGEEVYPAPSTSDPYPWPIISVTMPPYPEPVITVEPETLPTSTPIPGPTLSPATWPRPTFPPPPY